MPADAPHLPLTIKSTGRLKAWAALLIYSHARTTDLTWHTPHRRGLLPHCWLNPAPIPILTLGMHPTPPRWPTSCLFGCCSCWRLLEHGRALQQAPPSKKNSRQRLRTCLLGPVPGSLSWAVLPPATLRHPRSIRPAGVLGAGCSRPADEDPDPGHAAADHVAAAHAQHQKLLHTGDILAGKALGGHTKHRAGHVPAGRQQGQDSGSDSGFRHAAGALRRCDQSSVCSGLGLVPAPTASKQPRAAARTQPPAFAP